MASMRAGCPPLIYHSGGLLDTCERNARTDHRKGTKSALSCVRVIAWESSVRAAQQGLMGLPE